jgi:FkbM family methyltransferase
MKRRGGIAWLPEGIARIPRTPEQLFWMSENLEDLVIYDIGAFHGLLSLYFASKARQVISYEPNVKNHARLMENLRLNNVKNVLVRKLGVSSKKDIAQMVSARHMLGGASIARDTIGGILNSDQPVHSEQILVTTLDDDIREFCLPKPDFIKVDVEGAEFEVLIGARNIILDHHPRLFLEMHGETMNMKRKNVAALVDILIEMRYSHIRHIESGTLIDESNSFLAAEGHLYCR